ncbi:MAG TPA: type II toxin-antitoxin system prevent-host-death family antitoxin [Candidatus Eisenbacteria bacterium]|nr:type II toxin-antitoxin system prevent-host-death family antitoxin [Candidatus Eisenbacteria bacterium]
MRVVDVTEARIGFSEILSGVFYRRERVLLRRRGRPLAVLVPLADLDTLEQRPARTKKV